MITNILGNIILINTSIHISKCDARFSTLQRILSRLDGSYLLIHSLFQIMGLNCIAILVNGVGSISAFGPKGREYKSFYCILTKA